MSSRQTFRLCLTLVVFGLLGLVSVAQEADLSSTDPLLAAQDQSPQNAAEQNFRAGITAFASGDCQGAIPLLSNAVDDETQSEDLILITQVLSSCLAANGNIGRARMLMRQVTPLVAAQFGANSQDLLTHNLTWAEFELGAGEPINAANRITEGLTVYLAGQAVDADQAFRALAAYSAVMVAQGEGERFEFDVDTLVERDGRVNWSSERSLGDLIADLPALDGTPTALALWSFQAMEKSSGLAPFQALLKSVIQGR